ncbi:MAG TPA: tRNA-binding protein [Chitinophagales bacterium]|nr:tRNA-binding protein [Chitinophagales bacterium]HRG27105.1 tRNA-binding protein [Chitinophagales bacterium]HRG85185.1 tRNA-binding protein [Chitinophagales bacterium]HRH52472.1 tRNA-binding protein [Chitinophagales bacterium]
MQTIQYSDFEKIEIRTGTIVGVSDFPNAKKPAYQLFIDFGELGIKKSSAQITSHYSKQALIGKQIAAVVNFPVKQIANFFSECLVLGAIQIDGSIILLQTEQEVQNGLKIA